MQEYLRPLKHLLVFDRTAVFNDGRQAEKQVLIRFYLQGPSRHNQSAMHNVSGRGPSEAAASRDALVNFSLVLQQHIDDLNRLKDDVDAKARGIEVDSGWWPWPEVDR